MQYALIRWVDPSVMFQEEKNHLESWPQIKKKNHKQKRLARTLNENKQTKAQLQQHKECYMEYKLQQKSNTIYSFIYIINI